MSLSENIAKIRNSVYGKDVREAIAASIEGMDEKAATAVTQAASSAVSSAQGYAEQAAASASSAASAISQGISDAQGYAQQAETSAQQAQNSASQIASSVNTISELQTTVNQQSESIAQLSNTIGGEVIAHFAESAFEACYPINTATGVREYDKWFTSVATNDAFFKFDYDISIYSDVSLDYIFACVVYNDGGTFVKTYDYDDTTVPISIAKNTNFRLQIRKRGVNTVDISDVNQHLFYKYVKEGISADVDKLKNDVETFVDDVDEIKTTINVLNKKHFDASKFIACYPINTATGVREYDKWSTSVASNDDLIDITTDTFVYSDRDDNYQFNCFVYDENGTFVNVYDYNDTVNGITLKYPNAVRFQIRKNGVSTVNVEDVCQHIYLSSDIESIKITTERIANRFSEDIIDHNEDMLDAVNAASLYGLHISGTANLRKCCSLLVTTDIHKSVDRHLAALRYLDSIDSIDIGCCLGDIQAGNYSENDGTWFTTPITKAEKPYLVTIGNHDCGNGKSGTTSGTTSEVVSKFITPVESKMGQSNLTVPYYSYDDTTHKIRFIVLYNYDSPDTKDSNGNFKFFRGADCLTQTQLDWFAGKLNSVPSGYSVVILMHDFWFPNTPVSCNFTQPNKTLAGDDTREGYNGTDNIIPKIVNAYKNRTTITESFSPKSDYSSLLPVLTANYDFSSADGNFICYLVGHMHSDVVAKSTAFNDQLVISFCATALDNFQNGGSDLPRTRGTKSEDAITVVGFDTYNRNVNLVRIGSNVTINMVKRDFISIPY